MQGLDRDYWVPEHVRAFLRGLGFSLPLEDMEPHIRAWDGWMRALGDFYDYRDTDGVGRVYEVHRRSIHPAMRVCREWGSLLLNDKTAVACDEQRCTDWLAAWMARTGFLASAQECVVRAFGLGAGAFFSPSEKAGGEYATTRSSRPGPFQLEDEANGGAYRFVTACFDRDRNRVKPEGVCPMYETGLVRPIFALVRPAIDNARMDMSPYGQSVFADAVDAIQAVGLYYDAMMSEIDNGKMRVFLSDVMFDVELPDEGGSASPSVTASSRTRRPRSGRTWTRWRQNKLENVRCASAVVISANDDLPFFSARIGLCLSASL